MAASLYNRKKKFLAPYAEGLVKQLTGFEENHKDYNHVLSFVYTHLFEHTFATVDLSSVEKSISGVVEKFKIHGLNERSKRFKDLVDKYLLSDTSQHTQLNVQWYVLLLLLKLSYRPTSLTEDELKYDGNKSTVSVAHENINWPEYLKEGWIEDRHYNTDSEDDDDLWRTASSEDDDQSHLDEEEQLQSASSYHLTSDAGSKYEVYSLGEVPHPSLWQRPTSPSPAEARTRLAREGAASELWLRTHVQNSWWSDSSCRSVPESKHLPANICQVWETCVASRHNPENSLPLQQTQVISEFKVLKEILWMLQISTSASLFKLDDKGHFYVKPNLSLPSTVPESLRLVLQNLCPYFTIIRRLRLFEEEISELEKSETPPPLTFKAYCAALFRQLDRLTSLAIGIETRLNKQEETMTLLSVVEELMPALNFLQYLNNIHSKAVGEWRTQPAWVSATRLLSVLYKAVLETSEEVYLNASLHVFIHSFHVYLNIIDTWLSEGRLEDWRKEFFVMSERGRLTVMPYEQEMRKCGVVPVSLISKLVMVIRDIGHTMEVVGQLNKLTQLRDTVQNRGCLFKEFSENVYNEIKRLKENMKDPCLLPSEMNSTSVSVTSEVSDLDEGVDLDKTTECDEEIQKLFTGRNTSLAVCSVGFGVGEGERQSMSLLFSCPDHKEMCDQMLAALLDNPLLCEAVRHYLPAGEPTSRPPAPTPSCDSCSELMSLPSGTSVGFLSVQSVLEKQLSLIVTRHKTASRLVTQTLRSEYSLLEHFTVLRTVFFMENGCLAQSFYSNLFKEIQSGGWSSSVSLSVQLQLIVEDYHPGFGNYFSVVVTRDSKSSVCDVHQAIPFISLDYKVDWPVSLVVSQDMIESYNKVFRFLLHLKFAFWTLHNMHFTELSSSPDSLRVRRLQVLKSWMFHSTNTLHAYFMGLVLRSFSKHLDQSTQLADSVHVIVEAHNKFLEEIKIHCLQNKKSYVETFIMKLLRLCSVLSDQWEKEASGTLSIEDFQSLEEQYVNAYNGLVHCLDVVTNEEDAGSFLFELKSEISSSIPGILS